MCTATKKNPRMVRRRIVTKFIGRPGVSQRVKIIASDPKIKPRRREISLSVLGRCAEAVLCKKAL
jgi:hypothetical protein